jgi:hypothetical protein
MEPLNFCPQCGHGIRAATRFCAKCGVELKFAETVQDALRPAEDEVAQAEPGSSHRSWRPALTGVLAVVLFGVGGYFGVRFLTGSSGGSSPSSAVRSMVLAANEQRADAFQERLSTWFAGELQREQRRRSPGDLLAEWTQNGSIEHIDILAEQICDGEAAVYYQLRFGSGPPRREYAHLVTENGIWKINDFIPRGRRSCTVPESALASKPIQTWTVPKATPPNGGVPPEALASGATAQQGLSRATAKVLISRYSRFGAAPAMVITTPGEAVKAGVREGLWAEQGFGGLVLTQEGRRYFAQAQGFPAYTVILAQPARREVIEVTGIADAPVGNSVKEVSFTWRYVGLAEVVARYTGQGQSPHESKGALRLYDDGWRIEELMLNESARVPFAGVPESILRNEAEGRQRFLEHLQQSTRAGKSIATFQWRGYTYRWNDSERESTKVGVSDVALRFEGQHSYCLWFGQIDRLEVRRTPIGPRNMLHREIILWRKDNSSATTIAAPDADPGDFPALETALTSAHQTWTARYNDVASRLNFFNFAEIAPQARPGQQWYNREMMAVVCDEAARPATTGLLAPGLDIGSKWQGQMQGQGAELEIASASTATLIYRTGGTVIREVFQVEALPAGEFILRGVSYEFVSGQANFSLDTFRVRLSENLQSMSGTWTAGGTGQWVLSRVQR